VVEILCAKCGTPILEITAQKNGGLCAPCKSGKRESIEAAKKWYKQQREYERTDPFLKLWRELVSRAYDSSKGVTNFSEVEKQYFAVVLLDGEICNGGFDQYFFNSSGNLYKSALLGLEAMGAMQSLVLLQRAKQVLFDSEEVPEDTGRGRELLRQRDSASRSKKLEELNGQYWKDPDSLFLLSHEFARKHGLV
jgi:hypothetical protein